MTRGYAFHLKMFKIVSIVTVFRYWRQVNDEVNIISHNNNVNYSEETHYQNTLNIVSIQALLLYSSVRSLKLNWLIIEIKNSTMGIFIAQMPKYANLDKFDESVYSIIKISNVLLSINYKIMPYQKLCVSST